MLTVISTNVVSEFVESIILKFLLLPLYRPTYRILDEHFCCCFLPLQRAIIIIIIIIIIMGALNGFYNFDILLLIHFLVTLLKHIPTAKQFKKLYSQ